MKTFKQLLAETAEHVNEVFPWDLEEMIENKQALLVDVREPYEFDTMHVESSINVPRGILETACEWDYDETVPELVTARDKTVVVMCRSGNRSIFTADVVQQMGYKEVYSLKTGLRGWANSEYPMFDKNHNPVDVDDAEEYFVPKVSPEQLAPK